MRLRRTNVNIQVMIYSLMNIVGLKIGSCLLMWKMHVHYNSMRINYEVDGKKLDKVSEERDMGKSSQVNGYDGRRLCLCPYPKSHKYLTQLIIYST
jgi:hypothetical protein